MVNNSSTSLRPYRQYNRKCKTCRGQLFTRITGTGKLKGHIVFDTDIVCINNCEHTVDFTEQELQIASRATDVREVVLNG